MTKFALNEEHFPDEKYQMRLFGIGNVVALKKLKPYTIMTSQIYAVLFSIKGSPSLLSGRETVERKD